MQIHEITYKKRVDEANIWSGIKSVAQQGINQALGTSFGGAGATGKVAPGIGAQTASVNLAKTLTPKMAAEQNNLWTQSLNAMMANQQVQSPQQLDQGDLQAALTKQINRLVDMPNWETFASNIDPNAFGGAGAQAANKVKSYMDTAINQLVANSTRATAVDKNLQNQNLKAWNQIASMVIQIQNMSQFNKTQAKSQAGQQVGTSQQAAQIFNQAGVKGGALTGMQSVLNSLGPIPTGTLTNTQRNILKAAGLQVK